MVLSRLVVLKSSPDSSPDLSPFLLDFDLNSDLNVLPASPFLKSFVSTKYRSIRELACQHGLVEDKFHSQLNSSISITPLRAGIEDICPMQAE